jgi:D-inositol-3-phosphate glycosyltransferase
MHTSPLEQPGSKDAGGMNVYIDQTSRRLARRGVEVDVFTRAVSSDLPPIVEVEPGLTLRHVPAGPFEGDNKEDLPDLVCEFTWGVLRTGLANQYPSCGAGYDAVHSHYWLSGQVGGRVASRWNAPLLHTGHTWAEMKNSHLAPGDRPEPFRRTSSEAAIVAAASALVVSTEHEAAELRRLYRDAAPMHVVSPGVDLDVFTPGDVAEARRRFFFADDALVLLFVGRMQRLKSPDVLLKAAALLLRRAPWLRDRLVVAICGGRSGIDSGMAMPKLAAELGIAELVRFIDPLPPAELVLLYRAADVTVVPSRSESFGLVAAESQAVGTPVVAAEVGGLATVVRDGCSGVLVPSHDPADYAEALARFAEDPLWRPRLSVGAIRRSRSLSWERTVDGLMEQYERLSMSRSCELANTG